MQLATVMLGLAHAARYTSTSGSGTLRAQCAQAVGAPVRMLSQQPPLPQSSRELLAALGADGTIMVSGATFPVKDGLKAMRFRWSPAERAWQRRARPEDNGTETAPHILQRIAELAAAMQLTLVHTGAPAVAPNASQVYPPFGLQPPAGGALTLARAHAAYTYAPYTQQPPPLPFPPPPVAAGPFAGGPFAGGLVPLAASPLPLARARLPAALSPSSVDAWRQCALLFRFR
ncbi:hypothetical protein T492DRAFT_323382 [Pavlovales sp. CCMP2436]|nr:hypothetical protein T492DRAFT_323382 [Pavlovales sp. CCMP2436]